MKTFIVVSDYDLDQDARDWFGWLETEESSVEFLNISLMNLEHSEVREHVKLFSPELVIVTWENYSHRVVFRDLDVIVVRPGIWNEGPEASSQFEKNVKRILLDVWTESPTRFTICHDSTDVVKCFQECVDRGICCFDFETWNHDGFKAYDWTKKSTKPTLIAISNQPGHSYVIPLFHFQSQFSEDQVENILRSFSKLILENADVVKVAQNLKFELHFCARYAENPELWTGEFHDTKLMSHLWNENDKTGLKDQVRRYIPKYANYEESVDFSGAFKQLASYAVIDSDLELRLFFMYCDLLSHDPDPNCERKPTLWLYYRNLTMSVFWSLFWAEHRGTPVNQDIIDQSIVQGNLYLEELDQELRSFSEVKRFEADERKKAKENRLEQLQESFRKATERHVKPRQEKLNKLESQDPKNISAITKLNAEIGQGSKTMQNIQDQINQVKTGAVQLFDGVNFNSTVHMVSILYDYFKFEEPIVDRRTKERARTTARNFIKEFDHQFIDKLLAFRSIRKMVSTYFEGIRDRLDTAGNIHTQFLLSGTVTGRLSSRDPNLQNIPSRTSLTDERVVWSIKQPKRFFVPLDEDFLIVQCDYSQAELRTVANFADDKVMKNAYNQGMDIHSLTASRIKGLEYEQFLNLPGEEIKAGRHLAKGANFGLLYGQSEIGYIQYLSDVYGIKVTPAEAKNHIRAFLGTYVRIQDFHEIYTRKVKKYKYVRTLLGRKRRLPEIESKEAERQSRAVREAINSPIQGTASEFTLFAISLLRHRLFFPGSKQVNCQFFNTVHDSIFFHVRSELDMYIMRIMKNCAENLPVQNYFYTNSRYFQEDTVPMKMDFEVSSVSWGDLEEIKIN